MSIERRMVDGAPPPGGCYSHAVIHGGLVWCAGQIGVDPDTGDLRDSVEEQTRQALQNLSVVLEAAGSGLENVVQARVFLSSFDDLQAMNAVFTEFFDDHRPARTTIPCSGFPESLKVEIDVVAASDEGRPSGSPR